MGIRRRQASPHPFFIDEGEGVADPSPDELGDQHLGRRGRLATSSLPTGRGRLATSPILASAGRDRLVTSRLPRAQDEEPVSPFLF